MMSCNKVICGFDCEGYDYGGMYIEDSIGNNRFSYEERNLKKIYVPRLKKISSLKEVELGEEVVFCEVVDGEEVMCRGLKNIYEYHTKNSRIVYIFGNHNHAFNFWCREIKRGNLKKGGRLLHVDQHKDTREPDNYDVCIDDLKDVSRYTNEVLNVGSFIKPSIKHGIFEDVDIVDSSYGLEREYDEGYCLDIDLDFFSKDMDYIDFDYKLEKVRSYIEKARIVTIATSPYFIEQDRAVEVLLKFEDVL